MKKKLNISHRYDAGDEAFPRPSTSECCGAPGVDLLGYYAGLAMQGLVAAGSPVGATVLAEIAVDHAQALIDALNKHVEK